jgi:hypothetical protein
MKISAVNSKKTIRRFLEVNVRMNSSNPAYIQPLDNDIEEVFDPARNKHFKHGEAARWILVNEQDETIGRIAAFTNDHYLNKGTEFTTGCLGFFDCINDHQAAALLLNTACDWLKSKGMEAVDGPVNFGDRDKYWGLMVEGFDKEPLYGMPFNPPYYEALFEAYGFKNYYNQYYYARAVSSGKLPERFKERHEKFRSKPGYSAKHLQLNELDKYAADFATVYNTAWAQHEEGKEITAAQVLKLFKKMKPIIDPKLVWFAYYQEEPIAMWINIPDLNQYFKHFNGKFGLLQKLHLLWMKLTRQCKRFTGIAFGIVPKFQALGIDSFMIYEGSLTVQHLQYDSYEMGWAGDWNPKMVNIYKSIGAEQSRRMVTYRYIFNDKYPFERHPVMEYK